MDIILARQPIFDREMNIVAYELLYRSYRDQGPMDRAVVTDGDQATSSVIIDAFTNMGIETITDGKPAFINFTENMILGEYATLFPKESVVVEILEDIDPGNDLIMRCMELRRAGYKLALDDFVFTFRHLPLIQMADIIKMDFMTTSHDQLREIVEVFKPDGLQFLAEKVETREDFQLALDWGYEYFQGYFFSKPVLMRAVEIVPSRFNLMRLLHETTNDDFEYAKLTRTIMQDLGLTMKFLKLLNFVIPHAEKGGIKNIRQGIVLLGIEEFRKWLYLMVMKDFAQDQPDALSRLSLIKARGSELIGSRLGIDPDESFLVGLFSLSDTIMHMPMEDVLRDLVVSDAVKQALLQQEGRLAIPLQIISAYDTGDWPQVEELLAETDMSLGDVAEFYLEAVRWCDALQDDMDQLLDEEGAVVVS